MCTLRGLNFTMNFLEYRGSGGSCITTQDWSPTCLASLFVCVLPYLFLYVSAACLVADMAPRADTSIS